MRLRTLPLYLIGNRRAILDIAGDSRALWVGLLFVFSAAFAREYDGEDLLREPWYLLIPVGASLAASFLLFLVSCSSAFFGAGERPSFWNMYRSFLTLFWMTAPLAWVYAIPYERFLPPGDATTANLWTLAFVAAWRVALMVRVVSVLTGRRILTSIFLVMAFADTVVLATVFIMPTPVIEIMGGVRQRPSESESVIAGATGCVGCLGILSAPLWGLGALVAVAATSQKRVWQLPKASETQVVSGHGIWILAAASLLIWLPILPFTQPEQWLRSQVERDMKAGRITEALDELSAHRQSEFPPGWDPPPRSADRKKSVHLLDVMDVVASHEVAAWVRQEYLEKFRRYLGYSWGFEYDPDRIERLSQIVRILQKMPEGPDIAAEYVRGIESWSDRHQKTEEQAVSVKAFLKLAEKGKPPKP